MSFEILNLEDTCGHVSTDYDSYIKTSSTSVQGSDLRSKNFKKKEMCSNVLQGMQSHDEQFD